MCIVLVGETVDVSKRQAATDEWERRSFIPKDRLEKGFMTKIDKVFLMPPGKGMSVPRGYEYVFTGHLPIFSIPIGMDLDILAFTHAEQCDLKEEGDRGKKLN